jgi:PAS domain S-box-containing protein
MKERDEQTDRELESRISQRVRVRLLVVFPLLIVLLLSIVSGIFYQLVEAEFGLPQPGRSAKAVSEARLGTFAQTWIYVMIGLDVAGAVIGFAIAYSITTPIRRIVKVSQRVATGDLSQRSNIDRLDDFAMLGRSFDSMVDSLNRFIELRNRFILDSFSGGLVTLDSHGTIFAMNTAAERLLGIDSAQVTGCHFEEVLRASAYDELRHAVRTALWEKEALHSRRVAISQPDGTQKVLALNASPMRDRNGAFFGVTVNFRDIEEWERFHRQLARTDQLAALGTFAAGLAHELRNPLGAIRGLAQLLGEEPTLPERCKEYVRVIIKECERLDSLVREVQEFAQPSSDPETEVDVNEIVRQALVLVKCNKGHPRREGVKFCELFEPLPKIRGNGQRLLQAVMNIVVNAIEATEPGGEIRIRTRLRRSKSLSILIEIENTGPTLDEQVLRKVFEPFYTTKDTGTGLGLAIAQQIVANHSGSLSIENIVGGVRVTIELPTPQDHMDNEIAKQQLQSVNGT